MTHPTQIPASVIPELVEHLMSGERYEIPNVDGHPHRDLDTVAEAYHHFSLGWYRKKQIGEILTAALEAFNEREIQYTTATPLRCEPLIKEEPRSET